MVVTIAIGVPGSGKTTTMKALAISSGAVYICPDDVRTEFGCLPNDHSKDSAVWEEVYRRVEAVFSSGKDLIFDATNARRTDRIRLVARCIGRTDRIIGALFMTPLESCLTRNQSRDRVVPEYVIRRMFNQLTDDPPELSEGFDRIVLIIPSVQER